MPISKVKKMFVEVEEPEPEGTVVAVFEGCEPVRFLDEEFQAVDEEGKKRYQAARLRIKELLDGLREFMLSGTQRERAAFKIQALYAGAEACEKLWAGFFAKMPAEKMLKRVTEEGPFDLAKYVSDYQQKHWKPTADLKPKADEPERPRQASRGAAVESTLFELGDETGGDEAEAEG